MKIVEQIQVFCILIIGLPLLGFVINGIGFRKIPKGLAGIIGSTAIFGSFVASAFMFGYFSGFKSQGNFRLVAELFDWISVGNLHLSMSFYIDQLTIVMLLIITGIGFLIHIYSLGYMKEDAGYGKFFAFLNLFVFFMLVLVMGSNYVVMFVGWEGVGLCSYLLIGFWNENTNYGNAARKAFIMNRIGDLGFLIGIFLIINTFGSADYETVFNVATNIKIGDETVRWITLLLFVGAMGKSAQIPLYTWLPDAMAGPTPVSALIHAATMVTAGIYMVVRSNVLYVLAPTTLEFIGIIGLLTALFAATIGIFQNDIKKVLAYSTVSQLGYMFLGLGAGAFSSGMFHVMTHAFFKALLFLGAGSVIHAMSDEQDIRKMGGLSKKLRLTYLTFLIGTIAIAGIPPFSGFFSKDEILAHVFEHNKLMWGLGVLGSALTSFYMFRLLFVTFFGTFRGTHEQEHHLHESPASMTIPLLILAVLAALGGFVGLPEVLGNNQFAEFLSPIYDDARKVNPALFSHHLAPTTEWTLMAVSVTVAVLALVAAFVVYLNRKTVPVPDEQMSGVSKVVYNKYYVDELYDWLYVKPLTELSKFFYGVTEKLVDFFVNGTGKSVEVLSNLFRQTQNGTLGYYIFAMVFGIGVILLIGFLR